MFWLSCYCEKALITSDSRIITHLCGGLGNQMFQHAAGRALALRHGADLMWDTSWYNDMRKATPRQFMLSLFPQMSFSIAPTDEIKKLKHVPQSFCAKILGHIHTHIVEPSLNYWQGMETLSPPAYIEGYWQNELYFQDASDTICADFSFPFFESASTFALAQSMQNTQNAAALHVRRGDYASTPTTNAVHGLCPPEYYAAALAYIKTHVPDAHIFIFSDDPEWVCAHFNTHGLPFTVVDAHDEHDAHHDMHLMTLCKHHVIANSSFSWWGAWLAAQKGITIAPRRWYADPAMAQRNPCPERWLRL